MSGDASRIAHSPGVDVVEEAFTVADGSIYRVFSELGLGFNAEDAVAYLGTSRNAVQVRDGDWYRMCGIAMAFAAICVEQERARRNDVIRRVRRLLLGEDSAHGLSVIQHDDESAQATPTYFLNLNVGWQDSVIAERMYLDDALGIAHAVGDVLGVTVDEPK